MIRTLLILWFACVTNLGMSQVTSSILGAKMSLGQFYYEYSSNDGYGSSLNTFDNKFFAIGPMLQYKYTQYLRGKFGVHFGVGAGLGLVGGKGTFLDGFYIDAALNGGPVYHIKENVKLFVALGLGYSELERNDSYYLLGLNSEIGVEFKDDGREIGFKLGLNSSFLDFSSYESFEPVDALSQKRRVLSLSVYYIWNKSPEYL